MVEQVELTHAEVRVLTESRNKRWGLEQYEFSYEHSLGSMRRYRLFFSILGPSGGVVFLFLRWAVPDNYTGVQFWLGVVGTALTVVSILSVIVINVGQWDRSMERLQLLSKTARDLILKHKKLADIRPVDTNKLQKWMHDADAFEQDRKDPFAQVGVCSTRCGFQHVGYTYPDAGVRCDVCGHVWDRDSVQLIRLSFIPWIGCKNCGVRKRKEKTE